MKGIYLITLKNGMHYIGSASGDVGIWSRWSDYVHNKHGGNIEMRKLDAATNGLFINDARFTLIEAWPMRTDDKFIYERENYWKTAINSRKYGMNNN